jgi:hypothetical protein
VPKRFWIVVLTFWPGLPQIWSGQEMLGLILGLFFAATLNLAVVAHCIWTEAFTPALSNFFAVLATVAWLASFAYTLWWVYFCHPERHRREIDRLFREATELYLQGRWNDARRRLERILTLDESDADTLMQLGTLYVRTQQPSMARRVFRQCLEAESGSKWRWEIEQACARLNDK